MLVLTRRVGEKIFIGENIEIAILGISHNQVRVGILAPKEITVLREEVAQRNQRLQKS